MAIFENQAVIGFIVLLPIFSGIISYFIGKKNEKIRDIFAEIIISVVFILSAILLFNYLSAEQSLGMEINGFAGLGLHFVADGFRRVYTTVAAFMWFVAVFFAKEYLEHDHNRNRFYLFMLLTLGATTGVFLSEDLYTLFIFFEMMSFTSYVWVAHEENTGALRASATYLAVAVIGGLVMLMGIFMLYSMAGTLDISELVTFEKSVLEGSDVVKIKELYAAGACMLFGFGAKAGAFPLHIWLPKAHPVAPAPFSALLSGILTKTGIYGVLILSCNLFLDDSKWGTLILIIGTITMFLGAVLALFSIDLKRTLACSSVSQIGFILVGIGMNGLLGEEGSIAISGALLHMVNHSLFKLVLFMAAGVVFMNLHALDLNEIRGFGRNKTALKIIFGLGTLGIMCIPLFSGYVSKTLIHEGIVEYTELLKEGEILSGILSVNMMKFIECVFLFSGGCTIAYMLKLFICIFIEKNVSDEIQVKYDEMRKSYMSLISKIVLVVPAALFLVFGVMPQIIMDKIVYISREFLNTETVSVHYFSLENLKGSAISIIIGIAVYFGFIRTQLMKKDESGNKIYVNIWPDWLDLENMIYRPVLLLVLPAVFGFVCRVLDSFIDFIVVILRKTVYRDSKLPSELEEGSILSYAIGKIYDNFGYVMNRTVWKDNPREYKDHAHIFALKREEMYEDQSIIIRSMSYALIMFCLGLLITLLYLIIW